MKIVFRVDASQSIGTGHVVRCLTLADALREHGAQCTFVCQGLTGGYRMNVLSRGHELVDLPQTPASSGGDVASGRLDPADAAQAHDAAQTAAAIAEMRPDWLIVDHYALDARWERALRRHTQHILAIDDLADRRHECDVLLDQNFYDQPERRYTGLVPPQCVLALGPSFALLRREFFRERARLRVRDGSLHRILVAMGGADASNETDKVLQALTMQQFGHLHIDVLIGGLNPHKQELLQKYGRAPNLRFHENAANVAAMMADADLSVGAGGTMNWERCSLGLPSLVIILAGNQLETNGALERSGIIVNMGWREQVSAAEIAAAVERLAQDAPRMRSLSQRSLLLMSQDSAVEGELKIMSMLLRSRPV